MLGKKLVRIDKRTVDMLNIYGFYRGGRSLDNIIEGLVKAHREHRQEECKDCLSKKWCDRNCNPALFFGFDHCPDHHTIEILKMIKETTKQ